MTTYNTGNPVPSAESKDLYDNAENFDSASNSEEDTWVDRLGVTKDTLNGRLKKLGYEPPILYASGISFTINDNVKTVDENGSIYAPKPSELPLTTTGVWAGGDENKFYVVQGATDASIINDLSQEYIFPTVAAYQASAIVFGVGKQIFLGDEQAYFNVIAGKPTSDKYRIINSSTVDQSIQSIVQSYRRINSKWKAQKQQSVVEKMRKLGTPTFNYIRTSGGVIYVGSIFGGNPYNPLDNTITGTEWEFSINDDGLWLLTGGRTGFADTATVVQPEITVSGDYELFSAPNSYAATVGSKFNGVFAGSKVMRFKHYADNRGGLWRFTVNGTVTNVSTYSSTASTLESVVASNLDPNKEYYYEAEFVGDDPLNSPSSGVGTGRGWLFYTPGVSSEQPVLCTEFSGLTGDGYISANSSINDFAILARPAGSDVDHMWVPQHGGGSGVSINISTKIFVDDLVYHEGITGAPTSPIAELAKFRINTLFTGVNANSPSDIWKQYINHEVVDGVLTIDNRLDFVNFADISVAYLALVGADVSKLERIVFADGKEGTTSTIASTNESNASSGVMYAGTFSSANGLYHGIGCDVDVNSSCNINTDYEAEYINLQAFRTDNVNKTYWRASENVEVPTGTTWKSSATHYMINGVRFPNININSI